MSNSSSSDDSLVLLFKQEADNHTQGLYETLIEYEKDPSQLKLLESLMRYAHSLKGAARIIGLKAYSGLAHLIEDIFVAAQENKISLKQEDFDVILKGIDLLAQVKDLDSKAIIHWPDNDTQNQIDEISPQLKAVTAQSSSSPISHKAEVASPNSSPNTLNPLDEVLAMEMESQIPLLEKSVSSLQENPTLWDKQKTKITNCLDSIAGPCLVAENNAVQAILQSIQDLLKATPGDKTSIEALAGFIDTLKEGQPKAENSPPVPKTQTKVKKEPASQANASQAPETTKKGITDREIGTGNDQEEVNPKVVKAKSWKKSQSESFVRVSAESLSRIMGLAAESLVETRKLQPLGQGLLNLKELYYQMTMITDSMVTHLEKHGKSTEIQNLKSLVIKNSDSFKQVLDQQSELFEKFTRTNTLHSSKLYREILASRMRPFGECVQAYPRMVRGLARTLNKDIELVITGKSTPVDRDLFDKLDASLNHLVRNACDHGIESTQERIDNNKPEKGTVRIDAHHRSGMLLITISDDGGGIDKEKLRAKILKKQLVTEAMAETLTDAELHDFLFLPGFSTKAEVSEISGRGVGLDVVRKMLQDVGGNVRMDSTRGKGTQTFLELPATRSVVRCLIIQIANQPYALPLSKINRTLEIDPSEIEHVHGKSFIRSGQETIAITSAKQILGLEESDKDKKGEIKSVVLGEPKKQFSIIIDSILGEAELVVRPLDSRLGKVPCVSAASIMEDGTPTLILDTDDLLTSLEKLILSHALEDSFADNNQANRTKKRILVVDDSITVRETERQVLEKAGYLVSVATDGADGWNTLRSEQFDLVVSDIDMPRMNGIEFVTLIKQNPKLRHIPVIIVSYKDRSEDREQGMQAGADYYLTKSSFRDDTFINVVHELIGEA